MDFMRAGEHFALLGSGVLGPAFGASRQFYAYRQQPMRPPALCPLSSSARRQFVMVA